MLALAAIALAASAIPAARGAGQAALAGRAAVERLRGPQPFQRRTMRPAPGTPPLTIDARGAHFRFATSRNPAPTPARDCSVGGDPVLRYPLVIEAAPGARLVGGLFEGRVPMGSAWRASYCNSAALTLEGSPRARVDSVRIAGAWDGVRIGAGSPGARLSNVWISEARDDAIENDRLLDLSIEDSLIERSFQAISLKPRRPAPGAAAAAAADPAARVRLTRVLIHLVDFPFDAERRMGAVFKSDPRAPAIRIEDSVIAVESATDRSYPGFWRSGWARVEGGSGNRFLWLSDRAIPAGIVPPRGFTVLTGAAARTAWAKARQRWIDCHPALAHAPGDPAAHPSRCAPRRPAV